MKSKTNFKILLVLGIVLSTILLLNINLVNAVEHPKLIINQNGHQDTYDIYYKDIKVDDTITLGEPMLKENLPGITLSKTIKDGYGKDDINYNVNVYKDIFKENLDKGNYNKYIDKYNNVIIPVYVEIPNDVLNVYCGLGTNFIKLPVEKINGKNYFEHEVTISIEDFNVEVMDGQDVCYIFDTDGKDDFTTWKRRTNCIVFNRVLVENEKELSSDEKYVKNLKLTSPKYYEVDLDFLINVNSQETFELAVNEFYNMIAKSYEKQINDDTITIKATSKSGGTDGGLNLWNWHSGTILEIYKNNVLCDTRSMGQEFTVPVITVPSDISENELNDYIVNIITKSYKEFGEGITKIEKGTKSDVMDIEIPNGYTIYSDYGETSYVIIRNEEVTEPVTTTDTETNIKLETDTNVVPKDTVLEVTLISNGSRYNIVKRALQFIKNFKVFDINLLSKGIKIQPDGSVKISIPIPENFDKSKLVVFRVTDNGEKIEYNVTVNGNDATFETNHFSTYVLAEKEVEEPTQTVDKGEKDETPKTGTVDIIGYVSLIALVSLVGIVELKKKLK